MWYNCGAKGFNRDMRKPKIYLETTLFNYYFDTDRDAHADTVTLFKEIAAGKYDAYTSGTVIEELTLAPVPKRDMMMMLVKIYGITVLPITDDVNDLANIYIAEKIIPAKNRRDAIHIAVTAVNKLDCIISMNFKHIVKPKTKNMTSVVNATKGYNPVEIISPMESLN